MHLADDGYCIITDGEAPTGGCTVNRRESTTQGVADLCPGNKAGDGACEQACGADAGCDEKFPGYYCGTNGRCTNDCLCCEASDSDNGINYNVKGITKGFNTTTQSCEEKTDYCLGAQTLLEYYIGDNRELKASLGSCYCKNQQAGCCYDGRCVECLKDDDCPARDNKVGRCRNNICKWPACEKNKDCVDRYCCDADPAIAFADRGDGSCSYERGTIYKNKYLCTRRE